LQEVLQYMVVLVVVLVVALRLMMQPVPQALAAQPIAIQQVVEVLLADQGQREPNPH
jgi:hypothetical protein